MTFLRRTTGSLVGSSGVIDGALLDSKAAIHSSVVDAIKELQVIYKDTTHSSTIGTDQDSTILLNALEALFIHGLKDYTTGWSRKSKSSLRGVEPNFWTYLLIFSHKDTIQRIDSLRQINSDVGRSRAWLRLALNDGLLGSYLKMMMTDKVSGRRFYEKCAFMRDVDSLDIISRYVTGIEIYRFDLAVNSGLLNRWPNAPLIIAGLVESSESQVVSIAVEAAEAIEEDSIEPFVGSTQSDTAHSVTVDKFPVAGGYNLKRGLLNEDDALQIILKGGSGFGSPKLSNSSNAMEYANVDSYTTTDIMTKDTKDHLYSGPSNHIRGSSPLSESCPSKYQTPERTECLDYNVLKQEGDIQFFKQQKLSPNQGNDGFNHILDDNGKVSKDEIAEILAPLKEFINNPGNESPTICQHNAPDLADCPVSSSDSEEEVSIYATGKIKKDIIKASSDSAPGSFSSSKYAPVMPLIKPLDATDVSDSVKQNKIKPCDTISSSDVEDDFTNIIVTASVSAPSVSSKSSATSATSKEENRKLPCLSGFIDSWKPFGGNERFFDTPPDHDFDNKSAFGFRFQKDVTVPGLNVANSQSMLNLFDCIENEKGLDRQNYQCYECTRAIGTIFGPAKLCSYTRRYYCEECHIDQVSIIPARIVYNWDFKEYKVCKKAKIFLSALSVEPIIDASTFNKTLYDYAKDLDDVLQLRKELKFINAYLYTCTSSQKPNPKKRFDKMLYPRTYLYEDVNKYSVRDLEEVNNGKLKYALQEAACFARSHILGGCILCAGKGFICEICKDSEPLYPFDLNSIVQCEKCFAVFHPNCSVLLTNCPKCDRIEARNLKWHVSMSLNERNKSPSMLGDSNAVVISS